MSYYAKGLKTKTSFDLIYEDVCQIFNKDPAEAFEMRGSLKMPYPTIRHLTMALIKRRNPERTWQKVADYFFQDHTIAMYAVKKINDYREVDKEFRKLTNELFRKYETIRI